ncbi:hypothetical protein Zmor_004400 [Zophobas morio]|uniref:peptidylprolyl isomerase n=2 Tax=Zophobas morio TaxID=2755281 RepID=A0AA38HJX0_9CUCU|nr:hypothetical protein Zmor_004400 [Zophobas morio]
MIARHGKTLGVYYTGRFLNNRKIFDSCLKGPPFKFRLGCGEVIRGWDQGIADMKAGGSRVLTVPPTQAYGPRGIPGSIPPNSTLVFEIHLKYVK